MLRKKSEEPIHNIHPAYTKESKSLSKLESRNQQRMKNDALRNREMRLTTDEDEDEEQCSMPVDPPAESSEKSERPDTQLSSDNQLFDRIRKLELAILNRKPSLSKERS